MSPGRPIINLHLCPRAPEISEEQEMILTENVSICLWIYPNVTQLACEFQSSRVQMCHIRGLCNETSPSSFICFWFLLLNCINVPTMHCSFVTSPVPIQLHLHHHAFPPTFPTEEGMFSVLLFLLSPLNLQDGGGPHPQKTLGPVHCTPQSGRTLVGLGIIRKVSLTSYFCSEIKPRSRRPIRRGNGLFIALAISTLFSLKNVKINS